LVAASVDPVWVDHHLDAGILLADLERDSDR
jgi:hypothetical protein